MFGRMSMLACRFGLALCVAISGTTPLYAGIPALKTFDGNQAYLDLLQKIQTVDRGGDDGRDSPGRGNRDGDRTFEERRVSRFETNRFVLDLNSIRRECGQYDEVYRIDCLRQGIDMMIATMPDNSEYDDAKRILRRASRQLGSIVTTYADHSVPKLTVPRDANPRFKKRRSYTAVKRQSLPTAMAQANAVVTEAATQLLRSSENSERRYAHYQQISVAVDSTKVLLRSG